MTHIDWDNRTDDKKKIFKFLFLDDSITMEEHTMLKEREREREREKKKKTTKGGDEGGGEA